VGAAGAVAAGEKLLLPDRLHTNTLSKVLFRALAYRSSSGGCLSSNQSVRWQHLDPHLRSNSGVQARRLWRRLVWLMDRSQMGVSVLAKGQDCRDQGNDRYSVRAPSLLDRRSGLSVFAR
jgi:hypothetical protein